MVSKLNFLFFHDECPFKQQWNEETQTWEIDYTDITGPGIRVFDLIARVVTDEVEAEGTARIIPSKSIEPVQVLPEAAVVAMPSTTATYEESALGFKITQEPGYVPNKAEKPFYAEYDAVNKLWFVMEYGYPRNGSLVAGEAKA